MTGIISSILLLSLAIFSMTYGKSIALAQLPQANDNGTLLKANGTNGLFQGNLGLSNVYAKGGLFPTDLFKCTDSPTCGHAVDSNFTGTFEQGNKNHLTAYEATFTAPVTLGAQIKGHTYKITLTDTNWNSSDAAKPTPQPEFAKKAGDVAFNQLQHGATHVDRADVPVIADKAMLYGHVQVTDITKGNNTVVAKDVFSHVMVGSVIAENAYFRDMREVSLTPTFIFMITANIPTGTVLANGTKLATPDQAQAFTPLPKDVSLSKTPPFAYPVELPTPKTGSIQAPAPTSTQPVDNPKQPAWFAFLVFTKTNVNWITTTK